MKKDLKKVTENEDTRLLISLGEKIQKLRLEKKMTQLELARECDLDKQTIYRIEKGQLNITLNTLFKIADALDVVATSLITSTKKQ
ncbi:MAG: helix-turn-helix transcriptional regulator [Bacteroidia bacterium]|nr:helix-turn-helix transcriptional regulator [Bacteroidia bacterium]